MSDAAPKPLLRALSGQPGPEIPFWFMRQAGRYLPEYRAIRAQASGFVQLCLTPDLATEITLQPLRRYGMSAAILFSDILMVPYGLGQALDFREGEGPVLAAITDGAGVARLDPTRLHDRVGPVYETVSRVRAALDDRTALIGFAGAPWTVASYMLEGGSSRDFARAKDFAYRHPEDFARLTAILVDATVAYLDAQIRAGAEAIQLFDSWAGALSETEFAAWSLAPIRAITAAVKARHPGVPVIGFPKGAGDRYRGFAEATGVDAVSIDGTVTLATARDAIQPRACVQGNLDPRLTVIGGEPMRREALRILDTLGRGPLVFNLAHGFVPQTPPEHVAELSALVRTWRP